MKYLLILLFLFSTHSFAKEEIWDCPYTDGSGRQIFKISYEKNTIFVRSKNPLKWLDMAHKLGTVTYRVNFDYENDVATVEWSKKWITSLESILDEHNFKNLKSRAQNLRILLPKTLIAINPDL